MADTKTVEMENVATTDPMNKIISIGIPEEWKKEFDDSLKRKNYNGFTYVGVHNYRKRTQSIAGLFYDHEIIQNETVVDKEGDIGFKVVVRLRFYIERNGSIMTVVKDGTAVKFAKGNQDINYVLGAAVSEAFKRALLHVGIGMDLYEEDIVPESKNYIPEEMKGGKNEKFYRSTNPASDKQKELLRKALAKTAKERIDYILEKLQLEDTENLNAGQISMLLDALWGNTRI